MLTTLRTSRKSEAVTVTLRRIDPGNIVMTGWMTDSATANGLVEIAHPLPRTPTTLHTANPDDKNETRSPKFPKVLAKSHSRSQLSHQGLNRRSHRKTPILSNEKPGIANGC